MKINVAAEKHEKRSAVDSLETQVHWLILTAIESWHRGDMWASDNATKNFTATFNPIRTNDSDSEHTLRHSYDPQYALAAYAGCS